MHNIFALIIAALLADLVQCLTWAGCWLLGAVRGGAGDYARLAIYIIASIAFFAFAAVLLIALCIAACNEASQINSILNHKK